MSYSGGTYTVTVEQCLTGHPKPYAISGGGGTTGACPEHDPPPPAGPGTVACHGAVTVTFTWIPQGVDDPVPSVVVLRKESSANWAGGTSGSCDNGLGHPPVGGSGGEVSTGVAYEVVQSPSSPIVRSITPSASVSYSPPPVGDVGTAAVLVNCSVIVPTLDFMGTTTSEDENDKEWQNILIGQRLTATANLGGLPTGAQDTFTWSASSGAPFNGYTTTPALGQYHPFAPPNAISAAWHFASGEYGDPMASGDGMPSTASCAVVLREPEPDLSFAVAVTGRRLVDRQHDIEQE